jgi:hypothetical protein
VVFDRAYCYSPASYRVTILARRTELPPMNIGMAVRALLANQAKHFVDVTLTARDIFMHATKRELRLAVVVEFRLGANWAPANPGVAAFTRYRQRTVRIPSAQRDRRLGADFACRPSEQQPPHRPAHQLVSPHSVWNRSQSRPSTAGHIGLYTCRGTRDGAKI